MAGMNKRIFIALLTLFILSGCNKNSVNVEKTVDNTYSDVDKNEENVSKNTELSTKSEYCVDNSVDNMCTTVDNTDNNMDKECTSSEIDDKEWITEEYTVDNSNTDKKNVSEDIISMAESYYKYYSFIAGISFISSDGEFDRDKFIDNYLSEEKFSLEDYFSKTEWIDRGGYFSLAFYPNKMMFAINCDNVYIFMARAIHGFVLAKEKYGNDELWKNEASLIPQYHCHVLYAGALKTPWCIEPHRTETDFIRIMANFGNPDN